MARHQNSRGLDAEFKQLLDDPTSIGYKPLPARKIKSPRRPRQRRNHGAASPVFLILVALAAAGGTLAALEPFGSRLAGLGVFIFILAGWLVSVCLHEFAHAYVAYRGGDHSVIGNDYLRLNPFRYVHPLLSVVLPIIWIAYGGIGLPGGAVMIHRHQLRSRAWASAVSASGPAVNLALAGIAIGSLQFFNNGQHNFELYAAISWFAWLQVSVVVLNLLPIPGLDGWGIIEPWMSPTSVDSVAKIRPFGILIVVGLLWIPSLNSGFTSVVDHLATWLGDPEGLPWFGSQLFKFWHHTN